MKKYLIVLTAPSIGLLEEPENYIEPFVVEAENLDELGNYVDNQLMRTFALKYRVSLEKVKILFVSGIKQNKK